MPQSDLFLQTIDAVYAGGLDTALMPEALKATSFLLGSVGATLEVISKPQKRPIGFWSAGLPDVSRAQYIEHFASLNPRIPLTLGQRAGDVACDRQLFDEGQMKRDPFYSEFLPQLGLRYFVSIVLEQSADTLAVVAVQRSRKQGHVEKRENQSDAASVPALPASLRPCDAPERPERSQWLVGERGRMADGRGFSSSG